MFVIWYYHQNIVSAYGRAQQVIVARKAFCVLDEKLTRHNGYVSDFDEVAFGHGVDTTIAENNEPHVEWQGNLRIERAARSDELVVIVDCDPRGVEANQILIPIVREDHVTVIAGGDD